MEAKYRPMRPKDVTVGQKFIMLGDDNILFKGEIEEVLRPSNIFKAFCATDGCRYGRADCWVKITKEVK